ncbi:MAG: hypothetical protein PVH46_06165 [Granulosicoccaceae bacterium]
MEQLAGWEMLLLGAVVIIVLLWMGPGISQTFKQSQQTEKRDWAGFLLPIGVMVLFVIVLIMLARNA